LYSRKIPRLKEIKSLGSLKEGIDLGDFLTIRRTFGRFFNNSAHFLTVFGTFLKYLKRCKGKDVLDQECPVRTMEE
jgi:hypothetical protein